MSWCPIVACSPRRSPASTLLGEDGDHVVALRRSRPLACVLLTINAVLHKEMSLVFQVDVAVRTGVALGVTELVPQLDHHSPEAQRFLLKNKQTKIRRFSTIYYQVISKKEPKWPDMDGTVDSHRINDISHNEMLLVKHKKNVRHLRQFPRPVSVRCFS